MKPERVEYEGQAAAFFTQRGPGGIAGATLHRNLPDEIPYRSSLTRSITSIDCPRLWHPCQPGQAPPEDDEWPVDRPIPLTYEFLPAIA